MYKNLPYRAGVGIMLLNDDDNVFVGRRIDSTSEAWQMPQGGIDDGEEPLAAALREMMEETGTDKAEIISESRDWYNYDLPENLITKLWNGRFRGQRQKWFCLRFTGSDADINIKTEHPEFCEWQWTKMENLPNIIVPFKRQLYQEIVDEFSQYLVMDDTKTGFHHP
jgi:putative (di)nucleoside polyphosphate hydrolase